MVLVQVHIFVFAKSPIPRLLPMPKSSFQHGEEPGYEAICQSYKIGAGVK